MPDITPAEIAELRRLHEAATPGKWETRHGCIVSTPSKALVCQINPNSMEARLAVAARNALPRMCDTIESQRAEIERLTARVGEVEALTLAQAERIAQQSELLSRKADHAALAGC